jgi:hypothetical protein
VIWAVDEVSKKSEHYRVGFEIGVIPTEEDVGKVLNLLTDIEYKAIDKICQKAIKGRLDNITTDLSFDELAAGKGKVISRD